MIKEAPSPFELFAADRQYDLAPAVVPAPDRVYADRQTQAAYEMWQHGAATVARMVAESTLDTPALREKILALAGLE